MRAIHVTELAGPGSVSLAEVAEPGSETVAAPGSGVLIDVQACGVAYPDVLMTRGAYQMKPELPFAPGIEVAGTVIAAAPDAPFERADRVVALLPFGGMAERVLAPQHMTHPLPDELDFVTGAGLAVNYHTAYFALSRRGRTRSGEIVLVHGAAGGIGTACVQVALGLGAKPIAVVSTEEKERVARAAGAAEVVRVEGWADAVRALAGSGVDVVIDPVGSDRFADSVRVLAPDGRLVVVGFAGGEIPMVHANRVLFRNIDVVGAALGAYLAVRPELGREVAERVNELVRSGAVRPLVGVSLPLERAAEALELLDSRAALGKVVLTVQTDS